MSTVTVSKHSGVMVACATTQQARNIQRAIDCAGGMAVIHEDKPYVVSITIHPRKWTDGDVVRCVFSTLSRKGV